MTILIPPILAERLTDPRRLDDPRYLAEPKFDGQRAQVHVRAGRTVGCYSRPGRDLLRHAGLTWLRDVRWPVPEVVLDGELCAGNGMDGIQSVLEARGRLTGDTSLIVFDVLHLDGRDVMPETFRHRRTRLESLLAEPVHLRGRVDPGLGGASPPVVISGPSGVARGSS